MCLSETKLKPDIRFNIPGFSVYRSDRFAGGHAAGRVEILIRSSIPHIHIQTQTNTVIEHVIICLFDNTNIIAAYDRSATSIRQWDLQRLFVFRKVLVLANLNAKPAP